MERVLLKTIEAVSEGDLRTISKRTSYRPEAWLAWRHGQKPKIVFSLTENILAGEPSIIFTPPDVESTHPLVFNLAEDGIKQLIRDYHKGHEISEGFIESNLWRIKSLCTEYGKALRGYLESQMGVDIEKYLSSAILFLDSILKGNRIPETGDGMASRLKEILEEPDRIEDEDFTSLKRSMPEDCKKITTLSWLTKLYRGFVLLRTSIVDMPELINNTPDSKNQLFKILRDTSTNIPYGFQIETEDKNSLQFKTTLELVSKLLSRVIRTVAELDGIREATQRLRGMANKFDSKIVDTLTEASKQLEQIYRLSKAGGDPGYYTLHLLTRDCDRLIENCPKQGEADKLSQLIETIQLLDKPKKDTEEVFVVKKTYLDLKANQITAFFESLEKWIENLKEEVEGFAKSRPATKDLEMSITRISNLIHD